MSLLGTAAMLLTFDVAPEAVAEHDDWHTHEHLPERLAIPGFLRGTRWVSSGAGPRYMVLYEVARLETLASEAYLARLNDPSPWTRRMMPHYRGMTRSLCTVACNMGPGMGHFGLLVRYAPPRSDEAALDAWLAREVLPPLPQRPGLSSAHLLRSGLDAPMTAEQRIRGTDAAVPGAILVTGYREETLAELANAELAVAALARRGATGVAATHYRAAHTLTASDLAPVAR